MNKDHLETELSNFIHLSRYARWDYDKKRRETWGETVERYIQFFIEHLKERCNYDLTDSEISSIRNSILNLKVMPSMRALMTAGKALKRDESSGYNCAAVAINRPRAFDEIFMTLLAGTGCGFSVERQFINKLPEVSEDFHESDTIIVVPDSKLGWAKSLKELINLLFIGQIPKWDLSKVRPAGSPLKIFGGKASGPQVLDDLFHFFVTTFKNACGRKLTSIECHDLCCKIGECVVCGGVRRSAMISLSNLSDERMRVAKSGNWWETNSQRTLANNSVAYTEKPDIGIFMKEWLSLYESKSGERGIFSRVGAKKHIKRMLGDARDSEHEWICNPCGEILLRDRQMCNLSEVVVRAEDTIESLKTKIEMATILGTIQSTLTNFRYLSKEWQKNCEEERLLGVSLTGIMDNPILNGVKNKDKLPEILKNLREHAHKTNKIWAKKLGINESTAITTVKPSGTISVLVNSSSGIHPRWSKQYIRSVRINKDNSIGKFMIQEGFPYEPDVTNPNNTVVFSFPVTFSGSESETVFRKDMKALDQLELWKIYHDHWTDHNPSITVYIREHEWLNVGSWVYDHFDDITGVSFLPYTDHVYAQAPYIEVTEEEYQKYFERMPKNVDWTKLAEFEEEDLTTSSQEFACTGGSCEITDIINK